MNKERWLVQIMLPEGAYAGAQEVIADLTSLIEGNSEMEVVSAELDPDYVTGS